jgi:hypothetical protein
LTWTAPSSTPSSASSADALAPVSVFLHQRGLIYLDGGIRTDFDGAQGNHGTVDLVNGAIDLLQIVGVRDNLITSEDILY